MFTPEVCEFALSAEASTLCARRRDGSPTGWPMTVLAPGDGHIYFNTYGTSAKARIIGRDPRVAFLLIGADRALEVVADSQCIDDPAERVALADRVLRPENVPSDVWHRTRDRLVSGKRILLRMRPRSLREVELPAGFRNELGPRRGSMPTNDARQAGRDRNALALDPLEVRDFIARAPSGVLAEIAKDGYPSLSPVLLALQGDGNRVSLDPCPLSGSRVCVVIDRGASYSDYIAAIVHGTIDSDGCLPLDDVVSFEFARVQR